MNFKNASYKPSSALIVISIIASILFLLTRILGFDGLYGQDAYEYLRYAKAINNSFITGESAGDYFWPLYYPLLGAITSFVFKNTAFALSLISITSYTITAFYLYKTIKLLHKDSSHILLYVVLCFMLSPAILTSGLVVMSDMLSVCFIVLSAYHALKFTKHEIVSSLYFASIFAVSAIMTRYACVVVLIPFGITVIATAFKRKDLLMHVVPVFIIILILAFPHFYIRSNNPSSFLNHNWLQEWSVFNFFKIDFSSPAGNTHNTFPNIIYAFYNVLHPKFLFIGIVLIITSATKSIKFTPNKTILAAYILYGLFLAGIPFQNTRFLVLNYVFALIILFSAFSYLLRRFSANKKIINSVLIFLVFVQLFLCFKVFHSFYVRNQLEKNMATFMMPYQQKTLYSFDIDVALKGRTLNFNYKNLWVEQYDAFNENSLVLFNFEKFEQQWKDKNPIINWENIKNNYNLKVLDEGPDGWKLYEIQTKKQ